MNRRRALPTLVVVLGLVTGLLTAPAFAEDEDDLQSVSQRIDDLNGRISVAAEDRSQLASGVKATRARMDEVLAGLNQARADLAATELAIAARREHLGGIQAELGALY
ncbi:MAG: hypothetical protein EHM57_04660, partial [Actinobacteria bacterium]